jgi:membrane-bound lytic murein transglycosylase D
MDARPRTYGALSLLVAALAAGCSFTTQTAKIHAPFVPPASKPVVSAVLPDPPAAVASLTEVKPALRVEFQPSEARQAAESLVRRANLRFQHGKGLYQANEPTNARVEFDGAIDLLLEASAQDPGDRQEFSRRLDEMVEAIHRYDLAGLGAAETTEEGKFDPVPLEDILQMTFPVDPKLKAKVREQVAATASQLPLVVNDVVLGYINYFSNRGHRTIVDAIQRSGRYRPMIQRIFDEEGLPQELIHLAQAESGFYPRAVSRAAAGGLWQFMKFRGNEYGLNQTPYTDDRMDPEKATRAAAHHLHDLYSEFGDWYLAMAAYNCGDFVVQRAVERTGYADFWELRSRAVLPAETTNYVPIILAMTIMEKNAAEYGLEGIQMDPPLEYDTVEVAAKTALALVSDISETPLPELTALNPAILKGIIPAGYSLHVPKGTGNQLMAGLETIPPEHRDAWRMHRLGTGETLAEVGKRYGIAVSNLVAVNNLPSPEASEGDRLIVPAALRAEPAAKRVVTRTARRRTSASAAKPNVSRATSQAPAAASAPATPKRPGTQIAQRQTGPAGAKSTPATSTRAGTQPARRRTSASAAQRTPATSKARSKPKSKSSPKPASSAPVKVASARPQSAAPSHRSASNAPVTVTRARLQLTGPIPKPASKAPAKVASARRRSTVATPKPASNAPVTVARTGLQ